MAFPWGLDFSQGNSWAPKRRDLRASVVLKPGGSFKSVSSQKSVSSKSVSSKSVSSKSVSRLLMTHPLGSHIV